MYWAGAESNRRHHDFQSCALPAELPTRTARFPRPLDPFSTAFRSYCQQSQADDVSFNTRAGQPVQLSAPTKDPRSGRVACRPRPVGPHEPPGNSRATKPNGPVKSYCSRAVISPRQTRSAPRCLSYGKPDSPLKNGFRSEGEEFRRAPTSENAGKSPRFVEFERRRRAAGRFARSRNSFFNGLPGTRHTQRDGRAVTRESVGP